MTMILDLRAHPNPMGRDVHGGCAQCKGLVFEPLCILDDAYAVWCGRCPHCGALNFLDNSPGHGRGYDSCSMDLVLPTAEEVERNGLPPDAPTRPWPPQPTTTTTTKEP